MKMNFTLDTSSISDEIREVIDAGSDELVGAIYEEMETVKAASQEVVPYRFGILKASADVVGVNVVNYTPKSGAVAIGYGGAASAYSIIQHETPPPGEAGEDEKSFTHADGKTWKYLERPMMEAIPGMEGRLAERIRKRMEAR